MSRASRGLTDGNRTPATVTPEPETLTTLRGILLFVLLLGLAGLGAELLFLKHDESAAQLIAPGLIAAALLALAWHLVERGPASVRALQFTMALFVGAGALGLYFHYGANVEFQHEMDPSLRGMALFWKAMAAKTPPALAPGSMTQLGLIGLAYTFRHPALVRRAGGPVARPGRKGSNIDSEQGDLT